MASTTEGISPIKKLERSYPCREIQIQQLAGFLSTSYSSPSTLVVHGLEATGKSEITAGILDALEVPHAIVNSRECITARHLLEQTVSAVVAALSGKATRSIQSARCESLAALLVQLESLLKNVPKFVLVFDGLDRQREAPPTLFAALARFGETIKSLTTLFILTYSAPGTLHKPGVPHINFTPYTREESIQILSRRPPHIFPDGPDPDDIFVWTRFLAVVWDTLAKSAARDLVSFRDAALGLWEEFVEPIVEGIWGTRDFSKLLVEQKSVFQREAVLVEGVVSRAPRQEKRTVHELPYYSKFLLISAYLASHNPARLDAVFFMHSSSSKKRRRGGLAATMPERLRGKRGRKILRNHLPAAPFALERMFAIFHSILPDSIGPATVDLGTQLATLGSLRLIVKTSSAADVLEKGTKWRVNVTWEFIRTMARGVGFEIEDRVSE